MGTKAHSYRYAEDNKAIEGLREFAELLSLLIIIGQRLIILMVILGVIFFGLEWFSNMVINFIVGFVGLLNAGLTLVLVLRLLCPRLWKRMNKRILKYMNHNF